MSVELLNPAGLFALGALAIPIALHLARRSEYHVIDFAALRWLTARARPRRRVRLIERGLLALRLLLVGMLALLLAEPVLVTNEHNIAWTVIAPGVDLASIPARSSDDAATTRWLAGGFPTLDSLRPVTGVRVASLLRELDARLPKSTALTVWVPREMTGLDGASLQFSRRVAWKIVPGRSPAEVARAVPPIAFAVRFSPDRKDALRYLRAAWQAWSQGAVPRDSAQSAREVNPARATLTDVSATGTPPRDRGGALVWLRPGPLPALVHAWVHEGGTLLIEPRTTLPEGMEMGAIVWRSVDGAALARAMRIGRGRVVRLEAPFVASEFPELLTGSFAPVLRELLYPHDAHPDRALARDVVPVDDIKPYASSKPFAGGARELASWLAVLIAALFVIERVFATSAQRWRFA